MSFSASQTKLVYFDAPVSRGRNAASPHLAGIDFRLHRHFSPQ
jgi:hypothetical protein